MKKIILTIVLAALCLYFRADAQSRISNIKPLEIGGAIPEAIWNIPLHVLNHPEDKQTITLNEYRDKKLIILDFWATWCSSCIAGFAKIEQLQKEFPEQLGVILVTDEPADKVTRFLSERKSRGKELFLTTIIADTLLNKTFEHRFIPHYVWIGNDGRIINVTSSDAVRSETIQLILNGKNTSIQQKQDIELKRPLFSIPALPESNLEYYSILLKGNYPGLPTGISYRRLKDIVHGIAVTNSSLKYIFQTAARGLLPDNISKRIEIDPQAENSLAEHYENETWSKNNLYTYELRIPIGQAKTLYRQMLDHLNRITPYQGTIMSRELPCLALIRTAKVPIESNGGQRYNHLNESGALNIKNSPILALTGRLNNAFDLLVIDETGIKTNLDLSIKIYDNDLKRTNSELSKFGFHLQTTVRKAKVLFIKAKETSSR